MIQKESVLEVADNTGAIRAKCFHVYRCGKSASVGDIIMISVIKANPDAKVKKGTTHKAMILTTVSKLRRADGQTVRFSKNTICLLNDKLEPLATRINMIVPKELSQKIRSISRGVC